MENLEQLIKADAQKAIDVLKAKMIKNGNVYNSSGLVDSGFGASPIEIPGFVEYDNGFVRY